MKLHCQITSEDYIQATYMHLRSQTRVRAMMLLVAMSAVLLIVCMALMPDAGENMRWPLVIAGIAIAIMILRWTVLIPARVRGIYRQQKSLQLPYEVEITEADFRSTSLRGVVNLPWTDVHKYKVGKDLVLVYQSDLMFHLFPRRWFKDGEFEEFKALLETRVRKA